MAVTYGFYNALNHDRLYDAIQMSSIFDGIIRDGIFSTIGESLTVKAPGDGLYVNVGSGRAWFNHSWTLNDTDYPIEAEEAEVVLDRIDAVVLEVNNNETVRANSIKFIKGTPSSNPVRPTLTHNAEVNQYALAYVSIRAGQSTIFQADITNVIGTDETPFVTGLLQQVSIENLILQWEAEFRDHFSNWVDTNEHEYETWSADMQAQYTAWMTTKMTQYQTWFDQMKAEGDEDLAEFDAWFQHMKDQLDEDAAGHLQAEIDALALSAEKGSVVTVSTINASLYGRTVTISQGSESRTATFNNSGVAVFESIPYVGTVTVSSTDGTQTAESTLDIPYFGRYSVNIAFWAATVNISTTSSEFYNKEISVAKDGTTLTTISFDSEGSASYIAMAPGLYTFNVNYEGMDFSSSVQVTEETTYNVVLNAWTATVSIATGLPNLYGRAITISKGGITVGTTNFDSTGRASYKAHETGTYVISATDSGGHTYSAQVDITEETLYEVSLGKPDGKTATPVNDISIWLACAGITDKAYTTMAEVLADTDTFVALISDTNACDYMARSTGWALTVPSDAKAMSLIGKYDYCANALLSDSTWCEAIAESEYFESVLNVKVPTMTSNTTPSGIVTANDYTSGYEPYRVFSSNSISTQGWSAMTTTNGWVAYEATFPMRINKVDIVPWVGDATGVKDFKIQGYDSDSGTWEDIYSDTVQSASAPSHNYYSFTNNKRYSKHRLYIFNSYRVGGGNIILNKLQFYGRADQTEYQALVPTMTSDTTPSGIVSESGHASSSHPDWHAFDNNDSTFWQSNTGNTIWIGYMFASDVKISKLKLIRDASTPFTGILQGSSDGNTFENIQTINFSASATTNIAINSTKTYKYYRLSNTGTGLITIYTLQFYSKKEGVVFHSAANDTIYYMENGSPVILATTDANGKAYVDKSNLPEEGWKTLYSTVAKNPNNLSEDYSKVIHFSEDLSEVYLMPNGALFWYGYEKASIGTAINSEANDAEITKNTNNIKMYAGYYNTCGIYTIAKQTVTANTKIKAIYNFESTTYWGYTSIIIGSSDNTTVTYKTDPSMVDQATDNNSDQNINKQLITCNSTHNGSYYIRIVDRAISNVSRNNISEIYIDALWFE